MRYALLVVLCWLMLVTACAAQVVIEIERGYPVVILDKRYEFQRRMTRSANYINSPWARVGPLRIAPPPRPPVLVVPSPYQTGPRR